MLVLGPQMADRLAAYGCPEEKMSVLPLSIDVRKFAVFERRPPPAGDPICILSAGRLVAVKGMDVLLRAAAVLRRRHPIRIWIAGDGPERSALERLSRTLDLDRTSVRQTEVLWS
jgi:glycosyltransferase involved in cell wall biosynthesis